MLAAMSLVPEELEDWHNATNVHPIGLLAVCALGCSMIALPRRWASMPILLLVCLIPAGQRIVLLSADFSFLRLVVIAGWTRLFLRRETAGFRLLPLDWVVALTALVTTAVYSLQWRMPSAVIYQLGQSYDAFGLYFLFRCLLRNWTDLDRVVHGLTLTALLVAIFFAIEHRTGRNLFAVFGGVPFETAVRQGKLRCQGAFPHPILAGCFWAALLPLIASRWWTDPRRRPLTLSGILACLALVFFSASSTPMMVVLLVAIAAGLFPLRSSLSLVRWSVAGTLIALHMVMNMPVWHLVARIDLVGGSTGWHRYHLIDQAIRHVGEWWLLGTRSTAHWGWGLQDVTNQYVLVAVAGGLLGLGLFLASIVLAFQNVGRTWRRASSNPARVALVWALGCSLFAQCIGFIAVAYFGQVVVVWYLVLAATASLDQHSAREARRRLLERRKGRASTPSLRSWLGRPKAGTSSLPFPSRSA